MKISASLPDEDIAFVDDYCVANQRGSRSAVLHEAISLLRDRGLEADYAAAYEEWVESGDAAFWDAFNGDGIA